jgi:hypothetical protein
MADEAVRTSGDQLMVYTETRVDTPLSSEGPGAGPRENTSQRQEENGKAEPPKWWLGGPKVALPQKRIGDALQRNSPAGAPVQLCGCFGIPLGEQKR